jgi:hypothetical protein
MCIDVPFSGRKLGKHIEKQLEMVAWSFIKSELDRKESKTRLDSRGDHILISFLSI